MTLDPIPLLRWKQVQVPYFDGCLEGLVRTRIEKILQVGYRPTNGAAIHWQDVPVMDTQGNEVKHG